MQQHTPGPWTVRDCSNFPDQTTIQERETTQGRILAVVDTNDDQDTANARLIASAPDLLEALRELVAEWDDLGQNDTGGFILARAAIANAEGRA